MTKLCVLLLAVATGPISGQVLDLTSLDKFAAKAKSTANISLDADKLRGAVKLMPEKGSDGARVSKMLSGMNGLALRSFEFAKPGEYSLADLEPVRAQLKVLGWSKMMEIREEKETFELYTRGDPKGGFVMIAAEPKELVVISIDGSIQLSSMADIALIPKVTSSIQFHGPEAMAK